MAALLPGHNEHFLRTYFSAAEIISMAKALSRDVSTISVGLGKASEVREVEWHVHLDKKLD